jgi:hypothetical protein
MNSIAPSPASHGVLPIVDLPFGRVCGLTHRIVGITKSAPRRMPVGHREVIVFSRV